MGLAWLAFATVSHQRSARDGNGDQTGDQRRVSEAMMGACFAAQPPLSIKRAWIRFDSTRTGGRGPLYTA